MARIGDTDEYDNDTEWQRLQGLFYESGDAKYLWEAKPLIEHAIRSALRLYLRKKTGSPDTWIPHWNEKVEDGTLYFIERCINGRKKLSMNPESKRGGPIKCKLVTYCYWVALLLMSSKRIEEERQWDFEDKCESLQDWMKGEEGYDGSYISRI